MIGETDNVGSFFRTIDVGGRTRPGFYGYTDVIKGYEVSFLFICFLNEYYRLMTMEVHNI